GGFGGGRGGGRGGGGFGGGRGGGEQNIPEEYQHMVGNYTAQTTFPQLKAFVEAGGRIVAVGTPAMNLARLFDLPISDHLVEKSPDGTAEHLPAEKFYVPGSVLRMAVDTSAPIAH